MRMNELNSCFDKVAPTSEQKQRMLGTILESKTENGGIETMGRGTRRLATVVALTAAFVLMASTALAVGLGWHEKFMEYFGIGEGQSALLEGAVSSPGLSVTENGVTVEVMQTLADNQGLYVIFTVTVPNDTDLSHDLVYIDTRLEAETELRAGGYSGSVSGVEILEMSGNIITAIAYFFPSEPIIDGKLRLTIRDIGYWNTEKTADSTYVSLASGEWVLEWDFTYKDTSKKVAPNQRIDADGKATVTEVSISPVSICVSAEGLERSKLEGKLDNAEVTVTFRDGSTIAYNYGSRNAVYSSYLDNPGVEEYIYRYRMFNRFDRIIDPDDVVSVTLCGVMIPIG